LWPECGPTPQAQNPIAGPAAARNSRSFFFEARQPTFPFPAILWREGGHIKPPPNHFPSTPPIEKLPPRPPAFLARQRCGTVFVPHMALRRGFSAKGPPRMGAAICHIDGLLGAPSLCTRAWLEAAVEDLHFYTGFNFA